MAGIGGDRRPSSIPMRGQERDAMPLDAAAADQVIHPHEGSGVVLQAPMAVRLARVIHPHEGSGVGRRCRGRDAHAWSSIPMRGQETRRGRPSPPLS